MCYLQAAGFEGDVRKREDAKRVLESAFKLFGKIDILVNGAAGNFLVSPEALSPNGFRTGLRTSFAQEQLQVWNIRKLRYKFDIILTVFFHSLFYLGICRVKATPYVWN